MKDNNVVVGQVALSTQGRDKGTLFIITKVIDKNYVEISDGVLRKIEKPKLKKIKHLKIKPYVLKNIAEKLEKGNPLKDSEITKGLKVFDEKKGDKE